MKRTFSVNQRLLRDVLAQYQNTLSAFFELINNALQAGSKNIRIDFEMSEENMLEGTGPALTRIIVRDDGCGVSKSDFDWKILEIATTSKRENGGKGVGRFAGLQIGMKLQIETVAYDKAEGKWFRVQTAFDSRYWPESVKIQEIPIEIEVHSEGVEEKSYYSVAISEFYPIDPKKRSKRNAFHTSLTDSGIGEAIFTQYADVIICDGVQFFVNGKLLSLPEFEVGAIEEIDRPIQVPNGVDLSIHYKFIPLRQVSGCNRVFLRGSESNSSYQAFDYIIDVPDGITWYVVSESEWLDLPTTSLELLQIFEGEEEPESILTVLKSHVDDFFAEKYADYYDFRKRLKEDPYYPYRTVQVSSQVRLDVFSQLAFYLEKEYSLFQKQGKIRGMVYSLVNRALNDRDLDGLLSDVLKLDAESIQHYKKLSKMTSLDDVLHFSESVARKRQFLEFLHELTYGEVSRYVAERRELHKIVERNLWVFGEEYKDTPILFSDTKLRANLEALRSICFKYEPSVEDGNLVAVDPDVETITDLFFFNERIVNHACREIMVVELKAPRVRIHKKEIAQAKEYAYQIQENAKFAKSNIYRVLLVSSEMSAFAKNEMGMIDKRRPHVIYKPSGEGKIDIEVWVLTWQDLYEQCHRRLTYLSEVLAVQDREVSEYWKTEFPDVPVEFMESRMAKSKANKVGGVKRQKKKSP